MPKAALDSLSRELTEQGRFIEAGFTLRILSTAGVPPDQLEDVRNAFFAGAHHLFLTLVAIFTLAPGTAPTPEDLARMEQIEAELEAFIAEFATRHLPTKGSA